MGIDTLCYQTFTFVLDNEIISDKTFRKLEEWIKNQDLCWEIDTENGGDELTVSFRENYRISVKYAVKDLQKLAKKPQSCGFRGEGASPFMSSWGDYECGVIYIKISDTIKIKVKSIGCRGDEYDSRSRV